MIKIFQWLGGYVCFRFEKGFIEGFINDCFALSLNVKSLVRNENILTGKCSARTYLRLHRVARKNGGVIGVTEKHGPLFVLLKLRNRIGLLLGAVAIVFIINFLSGFVWNVDVVGNDRISTNELMNFLDEHGVSNGVYADNINRDIVENLIMASFDDCAWAHINIDGSNLVLEIDETVKKPNVVDKSVVTNVKARQDGIIVKVIAFDGWQMVKAGDVVKQGDMLISGIYEREDGHATHYAHARGSVIANVVSPLELTISRQQCKKQYASTKQYKSLCFFGVNIPLYFGNSNFINADVEEHINYLTINKRELPIGVKIKNVKRFYVNTVVLSDKELNNLITNEINRKINKEYNDIEIIKKDIDISLDSDKAVAKGSVTCLMDIAKEEKININSK